MRPYDDEFTRLKPKVHQGDEYHNESDSERYFLQEREPYVAYENRRKEFNRTSDPSHYNSSLHKYGRSYRLFPILNVQ